MARGQQRRSSHSHGLPHSRLADVVKVPPERVEHLLKHRLSVGHLGVAQLHHPRRLEYDLQEHVRVDQHHPREHIEVCREDDTGLRIVLQRRDDVLEQTRLDDHRRQCRQRDNTGEQ